MTITRQQIITWVTMAIAGALVWILRGVLAYFLVALIITFIGAPLMRFFDSHLYYRKHKLPRSLSAILVILCIVLIISLFVYLIFPPLIEQIATIKSIPASEFEKSFSAPLNDLRQTLENIGIQTGHITFEYFKNQFREMFQFGNLGKLASNVFAGASSFIGWLFIVIFITFFLLKEKYLFYRILHILTPVKHEPRMQRIMRNLNYMLGRYFRSLLLQIVVFGTYVFIGLSIFGEKYALTVAIFSGLVNLISYIGPLLGLTFALLFSLLSHIGADFYTVIMPQMYQVVLVYAVAVMLDNFFSYPLIFSSSLKVHPLELFFVILTGAQLGGLGGMIVAAPAYTVIRILAKETLSQFAIVKNITRNL